ncbi:MULTISPECIES: sulfotransferase [unclassified Pseudofrankia]|uniref:sulfotransferase family protein n=1 Tax=unclassified Pseudofrankia TaxID=2994372 RepID=UPI0008D95DE4|nr:MULTISPECIES: sulfotransferase [unclassified Pseudofrankia]MDT3445108.1 sulfotransferase [Pseudofrankia sp. BMG5.37]OHV47350.1 sulfotransferase [Pseudofrankia sp. BMG5.36]
MRYPTSEQLLDAAAAATGLADFGPGDFRAGLDVLLDSLERDGDLSPGTDATVVGVFHRRLVNRLELEAWYREHPETADLPVRGPVDVNGLPRTGTTALANILSLDPQFRGLRGWEQSKPCPPPEFDTELTDPRRLELVKEYEEVPAHLKAMHLYDADATMEDSEVLGMSFHGQQMTLPVYGYHAWWRGADLTDTFAYHRRVIQLLQSRRPPNLWLFKAPHHKFHLEPLAAAYPDARFVMTHRDPAKVVPSYASIVSAILPPPTGERDHRRLGREISEHLRVGMENAIASRARLGEDRFFDVHHRELVRDPIGTVYRVYDFLGLDLRPEVERAMADWHEANRSGAHGVHRYTAEQFGLDEEQIRADYEFYIRRFGIEVERKKVER